MIITKPYIKMVQKNIDGVLEMVKNKTINEKDVNYLIRKIKTLLSDISLDGPSESHYVELAARLIVLISMAR